MAGRAAQRSGGCGRARRAVPLRGELGERPRAAPPRRDRRPRCAAARRARRWRWPRSCRSSSTSAAVRSGCGACCRRARARTCWLACRPRGARAGTLVLVAHHDAAQTGLLWASPLAETRRLGRGAAPRSRWHWWRRGRLRGRECSGGSAPRCSCSRPASRSTWRERHRSGCERQRERRGGGAGAGAALRRPAARAHGGGGAAARLRGVGHGRDGSVAGGRRPGAGPAHHPRAGPRHARGGRAGGARCRGAAAAACAIAKRGPCLGGSRRWARGAVAAAAVSRHLAGPTRCWP